jgi:hypothetical protein
MAKARAHQAESQYCLVATVELRMIDDTSGRAEIDDLFDRSGVSRHRRTSDAGAPARSSAVGSGAGFPNRVHPGR